MRLNDVRRLAVRRQWRVRFPLPEGLECVVNEHGVGTIPGLSKPPQFNLEEEFGRASEFTIEPVAAGKREPGRRCVRVDELRELVGQAGAARIDATHEPDE